MKNHSAQIELIVTAKSKNILGNSVNYKKISNWGGSKTGNVTSVGSNGSSNYYELFDISGQVYEWIENSDKNNNILKMCRGGCYADDTDFGISKNNVKFMHYDQMFSDGFFGFRIASIDNEYNFSDLELLTIADTNNIADRCTQNSGIGSVSQEYLIGKYLVTNQQYVEFLNTVDSEGLNKTYLYDDRMSSSPTGGIKLEPCNASGSRYVLKNYMSDKPVTFIRWIMAAKFINWLHHNKTSDINEINNGAYNLNSADLTRDMNAKYFLPTEDEWYKAAYYDPTKPGYWTFGTKSDIAPLGVLSNSSGVAIEPEGYYYATKKFPIIVNKTEEKIDDPCPTVSITGYGNLSENSSLYLVNATISNLDYGFKYLYNFSSSFANWPCKIHPLTGAFIAYTGENKVNAIVEFCPKNFYDVSICQSNLNYISLIEDHDEQKNFLLNLKLSVSKDSEENCSSIIEHLQATGTGLPSINPKEPINFNVNFQSPSSDNTLKVSGILCCQPIPIVIASSGHDAGEIYDYTIFSSNTSINIVPSSGSVSFGSGISKVTAFVNGIPETGIMILGTRFAKRTNPSSVSSDQILLQCIDQCS